MAPNIVESAARSFLSVFFEYDTPRIVHIRSKKVGLFNRLIQLLVIGYIIGYVIVYKKGYQDTEKVQGAVTTKVKGIIFSNTTLPGVGVRTWDPSDYVVPPQENNAFFVMTNVIATPNQRQTTCAEDPEVDGAKCEVNADCEQHKGTILPGGNGAVTGECIHDNSTETKTCEIFGWCPLEKDKVKSRTPVLKGAKNFTVFIKNNIEFPKFGVKRRNIPSGGDPDYLKDCRHNEARDKLCPIFSLHDVTRGAGIRFEDIAQEGGVIQIVIDWSCNLDNSVDQCLPEYTFRRLDIGNFSVSKGYNFRYADKYSVYKPETKQLEMHRDLYKAYGVYFLISVQGVAGKFSVVPLLLNIGSGLALLGVATVLCDILVLYVLKSRNFYRGKKYLDVKGHDAFEILDEEEEGKGKKRQGSGAATPTPSSELDGGSIPA